MTIHYICDFCGKEIETQYLGDGVNTISWELDDGDESLIGHYHRKCANQVTERVKAMNPTKGEH